jgi:polysaccharide export outer membrane protein
VTGLLTVSSWAQETEYRVGAGDVLDITLWNQASVSGQFRVESDGTLTFPLVGRIEATGRTPRELETELQRKLADGYFKHPQVTVEVEKYRSQRVFVVGEIAKPGTYPLTGETSLIEIIAEAGPLGTSAAGEVVIVRSRANGGVRGPVLPDQIAGTTTIRIDVQQLKNGTLPSGVALRDGDTLFVPRSETIYVFGQVRNPGAYPLQKGTTVLQALSLAGGVTNRASIGRLQIVREKDGQKRESKAMLDDLVMPGDTIVVRERFF